MLAGCTQAPESVATREYEGFPDSFHGGIADLPTEGYAVLIDDGETLSYTMRAMSGCFGVATSIRANDSDQLELLLTPHQREFPCNSAERAVTYEVPIPESVGSVQLDRISVGNFVVALEAAGEPG